MQTTLTSVSDPLSRTLTLLEILQARDHVTGADLATRLQVDLRTVQRYIVRLKELGIPIQSSPGVGGSYRLRSGHRLPPLLFTNEEAFALSLGLRALHRLGLAAFAPSTEGALAKLGRVLPAPLRESLHTVEDVIRIEPGPWVVPTAVDSLIAAATAIRTSRRIQFRYRSHTNTESTRTLDPFAVLHTDDRWYLFGHDHARNALRTFRLDRVSALTSCPETFTRPATFDPAQHLAETMPFIQSTYRIDLWIDMPPAEAITHFAPWRIAVTPDGTGSRLRCNRDQLDLFAAMVLSTNRRLLIHHPPELRETFRRLATQALAAANAHT